jgi:hypothetical protein
MAGTYREMAIGSHAKFAREGDDYVAPGEGGKVSSLVIPDVNDASFLDLGTIESWEDSIKDEEKAVYAPMPGHLVKTRVITTKQDLETKFTVNQVSGIVMQLFYRTVQKLDGDDAQFNPLSSVPKHGWLHLERFSEEDVPVMRLDLWVQLKVTGGFKGGGGNITLPEFTAQVVYSPQATGIWMPAE